MIKILSVVLIIFGLIFLIQGFWFSLHLVRNIQYYKKYWYTYLAFIMLFIICYIACLMIAYIDISFINLFYGFLLFAGGIYVDLSCYLGFITMRKIQMAEQLAHQHDYLRYHAEHDDLTGCFSRKYFFKILDNRLKQIQAKGGDAVLLFMDLDNFKPINDNLGHTVGDEVLAAVGRYLTKRFRKTDIVARYGGDEFVVLLEDISIQQAKQIASEIPSVITKLAKDKIDSNITLGCSIGLCSINRECTTIKEILDCADKACYQAKRASDKVISFELINRKTHQV